MRPSASFLLSVLSLASAVPLLAADTAPDTFAATDSLGRTLPEYATVGPPRAGKTTALFYYVWHGSHGTNLRTVPDVFKADPKAGNNWDSPAWGPPGAFHVWGEPLLGYYRSPDPWVMDRHTRMLTDAGVDVLFLDVTNAFTYDNAVNALATSLRGLRAEGRPSPAFAYLAYSSSGRVVSNVWKNFYSKGLHEDLWFRWENRPLILAKSAELTPENRAFFTVRDSWAWQPGENQWPWLEASPQKGGWTGTPAHHEFASVSTASHPSSNHGKSYALGRQLPPGQADARLGLKFAEQWRTARALDPQVLFVTQWNEWMAQRMRYDGASHIFANYRISKGDPWFIDVFDPEFNRDIEPMRGGWGDCYYAQMTDGLRRFKGVRSPPLSTGSKTISLNDFGTWDKVGPDYLDDRGDTAFHDAGALVGQERLVNKTGRNDFVRAKVAQDRDHVYFLAETAAPVTDRKGGGWNWMNLWVRMENSDLPGWESWHFTVNQKSGPDTPPHLWRCQGGWKWADLGEVPMKTEGNRLALALPRSLLGLAAGSSVSLSFKWTDNCGETAESWLTDGDAAPNWRFRYRFWAPGAGVAPGRGRTYRLIEQATGRVLGLLSDGTVGPGENRFENSQKWTFCDAGDGTFALVNTASALGAKPVAEVLTLDASGPAVQPWANTAVQRWRPRTAGGWTTFASTAPLAGPWACEEVNPVAPGQLLRLESSVVGKNLGVPAASLTVSPAALGRDGPSFAWQANPDGTRILFVNELNRLNLAATSPPSLVSPATSPPLWQLFGTVPGSYALVPAGTATALAAGEGLSLVPVNPAAPAQHWRVCPP